jgi:secretion/DNA translocation related CpaE-like protein
MGQIIAIVPGSGGVGASVLAAAIAIRAAAAHRSVVAVDLDPWSGGLDTVFGLEQEPGWRWPELDSVSGVVDGLELAGKLPATDGVPVLSSARGTGRPQERPEVVRDVLLGLAATHDLVVLDVPRHEAALAVALSLCDAVVVVVAHHVAQLAAASVVTERVKSLGAEPWTVLRGPRDLEDVEELVRDHLDVSVLGRVGDDHRVVADLVEGVPPGVRARGPVVEIADRLLIRLASLGPALPGPAAPGAGAPGTGTGVVVAGVADAPGVVAARPAAPLARRSA